MSGPTGSPAVADFGAAIIHFKMFMVQHFLLLYGLCSIIVIHPFLLKKFRIIFYCLYMSKNHSCGRGKGIVFENKEMLLEKYKSRYIVLFKVFKHYMGHLGGSIG